MVIIYHLLVLDGQEFDACFFDGRATALIIKTSVGAAFGFFPF
jgi:hypothetical protein